MSKYITSSSSSKQVPFNQFLMSPKAGKNELHVSKYFQENNMASISNDKEKYVDWNFPNQHWWEKHAYHWKNSHLFVISERLHQLWHKKGNSLRWVSLQDTKYICHNTRMSFIRRSKKLQCLCNRTWSPVW